MNLARRMWRRGRSLLPVTGFHFDRPLLILQSDDWGRVGLRDRQGLEQLRADGIDVGDRPYDLYTLETSEDLHAIGAVLKRHRDSSGRHPCLGMNFIVANLKCSEALSDGRLSFLALAEGLPPGWNRPHLTDAYRAGISEGVFYPGLHGISHFCCSAVQRSTADSERAQLLHTLWRAGTPYIYWRMPWIGYEYWDPGPPAEERFLSLEAQRLLVGQSLGAYAKLFSTLPRSACAPGYRANDDTHQAWGQHGIRIAQNGPGSLTPPHFGAHDVLHLTRTVEFEPAVVPAFSLEACIGQAEQCFARGLPAIVSLHSINFHSTLRDFRSASLEQLDRLLSALESRHPDLLYLNDDDLLELIRHGAYPTVDRTVRLNVIQKRFVRRMPA